MIRALLVRLRHAFGRHSVVDVPSVVLFNMPTGDRRECEVCGLDEREIACSRGDHLWFEIGPMIRRFPAPGEVAITEGERFCLCGEKEDKVGGAWVRRK